jgi:hypothetical protein
VEGPKLFKNIQLLEKYFAQIFFFHVE